MLLLNQTELDDATREEIQALPRLFGGRDVLERAEKTVRNERSRKALDSLAQVLDVLEVYGVLEHVTIDLGELRGLHYHTGITFQGFLPGIGRTVCSGGRYNNLTEKYGFPAPATGFTFSLLNLLFALDKILDETVAPVCDLLVFSTGENLRTAQELACKLRQKGYSVTRDILDRSRDDAFDYASRMNYRYLAVVAGNDQDIELVNIKSGQKELLSTDQLLAKKQLG